MTTVFAQPDYSVDYDASILNTFHTIAASKVNAYIDESGGVQDLTLGASSNVNLEAFDGINIFFDKDHALTVFNTVMQSNVRTDTPILKVSQDPAQKITYLQSSNAPLYLSGLDSNVSTKISQTLFTASNVTQVLKTDLDAFDFRAPLYLSSNLDVSKDVVSHNNIACAGNMFSSSLNVYKNYTGSNVGSNSQVAFGFFINEHEHLELVKYHKYTVSNVVHSEMKRVATFGKMPGNGVGNLSNYSALNEFNGIVGQSNGNTPQMTNMLWGSQSGTSNVYYIAGNVGVGTAVPSEKLHVKGGNLKVQGDILPDSNLTYDLGSSNLRWKDLYLSGNTINLAGATITVTEAGTIALQDKNGTPAVDFSDLTSNANLALGIATEASNMAFSLASTTINSNAINYSSNTATVASNNSFTLSNYVHGANKTTLLWASNNLVKNTGGNVTGILSATQIGVGQVSPTEKLEVVGNIKATSNIYATNRLGVGTVTPAVPLHIIGDARIEGNLNVNGIYNTISTDVKVTDQFTVSNAGTGPSMKVFQMGAQPIADFYDDDTLVMRIDDGGKIGINTNAPAYTLDVVGDINFSGSLMQNGNPFSSGGGGGGSSQFSTKSSNVYLLTSNLALGKSNTTYKLDVVGTAYATEYAGPTIDSLSNLGLANSNTAFALSNYVYGDNTSNIVATSNIAVWSSNTARSASNVAIWSSNTAVSASNVAIWSSNNLLNKAGGTIAGSLDITSNVRATSNVYAMTRLGVGTSNPIVPFHVMGDARIEGNLNVNGIFNTINTDVQVTDQFTVSNNGTGPALKVHQMGAQPVADFYDDATVAMRIADGGAVGIGNSNPTYKLDVTGKMRLTGGVTSQNVGPRLQINDFDGTEDPTTYGIAQITTNSAGVTSYSNMSSLSFIRSGNWVAGMGFARGSNVFGFGQSFSSNQNFSPSWLCMTQSSNVGIWTTSPSYTLHVAGSIYATGDVTAYSDVRAKNNLQVISSPLQKVSQLTGYTYDFIDTSNVNVDKKTKITERFTGIIAQDLQQVLPEAVHSDEEGKLSVAYGNMAGLFVESIKELTTKNSVLEARVSEVETKICTCCESTDVGTSSRSLELETVDDALTKLKELTSVDNSQQTINLIVHAIKELDEKIESLKPKKRVVKK